MMEYTHYTTLFSMLQALTAGLFWGVYYDVFRILRRMIHFHRLSVAFQDLFFWITSAVFIFLSVSGSTTDSSAFILLCLPSLDGRSISLPSEDLPLPYSMVFIGLFAAFCQMVKEDRYGFLQK